MLSLSKGLGSTVQFVWRRAFTTGLLLHNTDGEKSPNVDHIHDEGKLEESDVGGNPSADSFVNALGVDVNDFDTDKMSTNVITEEPKDSEPTVLESVASGPDISELMDSEPVLKQNRGTIGLIGLGSMGAAMGKSLLSNGYKLVVYDISSKALDPILTEDVIIAGSPQEVAQQAQNIVTVLSNGDDVREVYSGKRGIFSAIQSGSLLIDSSTIDPNLAKEMNVQAATFDSVFLDASVSGGVEEASKSELTFMCGTTKEDFIRAEGILKHMGKEIVHCGDVGCGQAAKLCNNMLLAISMIGTSEVMNLGSRLGLKDKALAEIINMSTGRCWSSQEYNPVPGIVPGVPASNKYQGGHPSHRMRRDLALAQDKATATKSSIPLGSQALQLYNVMCKAGYSKFDFSAVYKFLREL